MNQSETPVIPEVAALLLSDGARIISGTCSWADFHGTPAFYVRPIGMGLDESTADLVAAMIGLCKKRLREVADSDARKDLRYVVFAPEKSPRLEGRLEAGFTVFSYGDTLMTLQRVVFVRSRLHPERMTKFATSPLGTFYLIHHSQVVGHNDAVVLPPEEPLMLPAPAEVVAQANDDEVCVVREDEPRQSVSPPPSIPRPDKERKRRNRRDRAAKTSRRPTPPPVAAAPAVPKAVQSRTATKIGMVAVRPPTDVN